MSQNFFETWKTKSNGYNFFKYSLIFAFSTILAENKYIFTYLIRISIKMTQNKYTYQKKVSRRNPAHSLLRTLAAAHWCHLPLGCLLGAATASLRRESRVMVPYHRSQSFCLLLFHGDTFNLENFFVFWTSLR